MRKVLLGMGVALIFTACEKEEIPIEPFDRGAISSGTVDLGQGYVNQVYFSLGENAIVGIHQKGDWDIALKNGDNSETIVLNDSRFMSAWKSDAEDLEFAEDTSGYSLEKKTEVIATAHTDPAMGNLEDIYLIDLGFNEIGLSLGLYWIEIPEITADAYTIRFKKFGDDAITEKTIVKTENSGFRLYSLLTDEVIDEPSADSWDFRFTKFTYQFIDPPIAYLVTGLVLNPENTWAAEFSEQPFDLIAASDTGNVEWSAQPDIIGYDWKNYSFDLGTYVVETERTWLIRNAAGFYYKFRFTGFYDENGNVGVPSFEYQLL